MMQIGKQIFSLSRIEQPYTEQPVLKKPEGLHERRGQLLKLLSAYLLDSLAVRLIVISFLYRVSVLIHGKPYLDEGMGCNDGFAGFSELLHVNGVIKLKKDRIVIGGFSVVADRRDIDPGLRSREGIGALLFPFFGRTRLYAFLRNGPGGFSGIDHLAGKIELGAL